jgi:hypothetical protein
MPWDDSGDFIRSGHKDPDSFEKDSFRTITIDEKKGIKAVIGKLKGEDATTVQSYLFAKDKDWTVEKAKEWFAEHAKKKEWIPWPGTIKLVEGVPNLVEGEAIHPCITVHPEEAPHIRKFLREQITKAAPTLLGKPLIYNHAHVIPNSQVVASHWNENLDAVRYLAVLNDPELVSKINEGKIKHVSLEWRAEDFKELNGHAPINITFEGLSLLEDIEPGDPRSSIKLWEGIIAKAKEQASAEPNEFIFYLVHDPAAFLEERFSTVWVDQTNGVQSVYGYLREKLDSPQPMALLFMKANGWTLQKMAEWLQNHPQYIRPTQPVTPTAVGIQPASPAPQTQIGVENVSKETKDGKVLTEQEKPKEPTLEDRVKYLEDSQRYINERISNIDTKLETLIRLAGAEGKTGKEQDGNDGDGEQEKLRKAAQDRADKYGISVKKDGHLTKPDEFKDLPEDQFADPVNYRYPVDKDHADAALKYFNQPDNRQAGGYSHEEAVKIMEKIVKGCLAAGVEVAYQAEDPVYKALPEDLKTKLKGYEKKEGKEALIPPSTPPPPSQVVPVEKLEAIMPSTQAERSMSYGAQRFVQDVKALIHEAKETKPN